MSDSMSNKELVAVGHQFAKAMSSDMPIIDMAKIVSRQAERLDCTTAALREMTKQRDTLAIGRSVDIAINHDTNAVAMHTTNLLINFSWVLLKLQVWTHDKLALITYTTFCKLFF
ncbi:hypothetical protein LRB91_14815 [Leclercia adecarboxylata]|uniref:hypothetical protein n=1 Tax=Leclercia adecarboxylata TaxID=83655 RepID=UPI0022B79F01|nr:hypothetical protein [Leclercia adecarboxylata]MCZ7840082.1 hypothetical protein [Leclercia adecarboxylata]WNY87689.1 hypothetical protein NRF19_24825 [Leclercia adecarboxylata]